jgi:hypothetical protein
MTVRHTTAPAPRARRHHPLANRCVLAVLRSPLHPLLDPGLCEVRYQGRRSGRRHALPVMYAEADGKLVVLVGDAASKTWWRNFRRPLPVTVRRAGVLRSGVARILKPGDDGYAAGVQGYVKRHKIEPHPTDRLLVIDPSEGA